MRVASSTHADRTLDVDELTTAIEDFNTIFIRNVTAHDRGGHFIPWEIPDEWVADLRRTFRGRC